MTTTFIDLNRNKKEVVGYLLRIKFPFSVYARNWGKPKVPPHTTRSPSGSTKVDSEATLALVQEYEEALKALSDDDLLTRYRDTVAEEAAKKEASFAFNAPFAKAGFAFWAKVSTWFFDEMIALSLDRDPRKVSWEAIKSHRSNSSFVKSYEDRKLIVARAIEAGQLYPRTTASIFVAWADRMQVSYPPKLKSELQALGVQVGDWKSLYDQTNRIIDTLNETVDTQSDTISSMRERLQKREMDLVSKMEKKDRDLSLSAPEKTTLLKLIAAMAIRGYSFKPSAKRNDATGDIQSDLDHLGIGLDAKTVLKWIREACSVVDPEHLP